MVATSHLLVIDDDRRLRELLQKYLEENGYQVLVAASAQEARQKLAQEAHLIILDLMMPEESGLEFLKWLRHDKKNDIPVLMLTAMGEVDHRIEGLEAGADDYLAKPFEPRELLLRIRNLLQRKSKLTYPGSAIRLGMLTYDPTRATLKCGDKSIHLTSLEVTLMNIFSQQPGVPISREKLAELSGVSLSPRTVDVQITRLRKKIEKDPKQPLYLHTVRHQGYVLRPDII
ncbi:MAG: DNA-binding response regulator [Caedibacter sp. 38-128]|nr:response regulator transcription factor [Holosporales bacterium]OJX07206.1 MAG: DNA-binding response regulator [Caedibacter sp. 38-128]